MSKRGNTWSWVIEIGKNAEGKRRQKSKGGYTSKPEAEKALQKVLHELTEDSFVPDAKETIESFLLNTWLPKKRQETKPSTYATYSWAVRIYLAPSFGHMLLDQLSPRNILKLYDSLLNEKQLAPQTVKHIHRALHDIYETAIRFGVVRKNPVKLVKSPKVPRKEMKVWTERQIARFLEANKQNQLYIIYLLAVTTGMRLGEILGLQWRDIDWNEEKLTVWRSFTRYDKTDRFQSPKTAAGFRTISLPKQAIEGLREQQLKQERDRQSVGEGYEDSDLVATSLTGKTPQVRQFHEAWLAAIRRAGLPRIRFHDLRHTHASLLLKAGIHIKIVSQRLGHSSVTITLDRYSHVLPGLEEQAAAKLDELLTNAAAEVVTNA